MLCDDLNVKEIQNRGDMCIYMGFPGGSAGKELPAMQETPVQFLGQEVPLERSVEQYNVKAVSCDVLLTFDSLEDLEQCESIWNPVGGL